MYVEPMGAGEGSRFVGPFRSEEEVRMYMGAVGGVVALLNPPQWADCNSDVT